MGLWNNVLDTEQTVDALTRLKNVFSIPQNTIEEGQVADISMFNPDKEWTFTEEDILSTSKNAALLGTKLKGKVYGSYSNKTLVLS